MINDSVSIVIPKSTLPLIVGTFLCSFCLILDYMACLWCLQKRFFFQVRWFPKSTKKMHKILNLVILEVKYLNLFNYFQVCFTICSFWSLQLTAWFYHFVCRANKRQTFQMLNCKFTLISSHLKISVLRCGLQAFSWELYFLHIFHITEYFFKSKIIFIWCMYRFYLFYLFIHLCITLNLKWIYCVNTCTVYIFTLLCKGSRKKLYLQKKPWWFFRELLTYSKSRLRTFVPLVQPVHPREWILPRFCFSHWIWHFIAEKVVLTGDAPGQLILIL